MNIQINIKATLIKEEIVKIIDYKEMHLPGRVIDEKVVSAGKKLSLHDVKTLLTK